MTKKRLSDRIRRKLGMRPKLRLLADRYPQYAIGSGSYGELEIVDYGEGSTFAMGSYCSVAAGVKVHLGGGHRTDWVTTYPFTVLEDRLRHIPGHPVTRGNVTIGSDVWLAADCTILSGVTIGHGAVVMNRALVARDVEPYAIVGGVPAQPRGKRFDETTIDRLLAVAWWDWDHERIVAAGEHLLAPDITRFLDLAEDGRL